MPRKKAYNELVTKYTCSQWCPDDYMRVLAHV